VSFRAPVGRKCPRDDFDGAAHALGLPALRSVDLELGGGHTMATLMPEGTEVEVVLVNDDFDAEERARLIQAIVQGEDDIERGAHPGPRGVAARRERSGGTRTRGERREKMHRGTLMSNASGTNQACAFICSSPAPACSPRCSSSSPPRAGEPW
jgi:hypothetical protein